MKYWDTIDVSLFNSSLGKLTTELSLYKDVLTLKYPCVSSKCTPYVVKISPGSYKFGLYGASGGYLSSDLSKGGRGAYTSGILSSASDLTLYIYLGEQGKINASNGYNGGGNGTIHLEDSNTQGGSGGGASDIRLIPGSWDDFDSLKSRIMVSGGGAGSQFYNQLIKGGNSGLNGSDGTQYGIECSDPSIVLTNALGGKQTSGGQGGISYEFIDMNGQNGGFGFGGNACNAKDAL